MNRTHIYYLDSVTQSLEIKHASTKFEIDQLRAVLNDEHYLKSGRPAGNTVWQGIYQRREDRAPKRNPKGAKNLALTRNAPLAVIPFEQFGSLNDAFDYYRDHREKSVGIIKTASPCEE